MKENEITLSEKAAVALYLVDNPRNLTELFTLANGPERAKNLTEKSLKVMATNWFRSHKIQTVLEQYTALIEEKSAKLSQKKQITKGSETEQTKSQNGLDTDVNFLDRDDFLKFLNLKANSVQDDKLRNEILKMLSDNLRYKDTDKQENTEIQRFYTPVTCENCEIYKKCRSCKVETCPKKL